MQHYREVRQAVLDFLKNVQPELGVGAGLELIRAVGGADGNRERVAAAALDEFLNVLRPGIGAVLGGDVNLVQSAPLLLVECVGPSSVESSRLARRASARLRNVAAGWPGVSAASAPHVAQIGWSL